MFQIVVDSAANIPAELVKKYDIRVISFVNYVNGKRIVCFDPDLTPEEERAKGREYYDAVRAGADVKTGLVSSGDFEDLFRSILEAGDDILYFSLSKNISGTYNSARIAAEELSESFPDRKIRLIDALNASLAQGILAIYASEMRAGGKSLDETADILATYPAKMNGVFTVGDLKYLSKTGRISSSAALVGNLLSIKPILRGNKDGFIVQFKKCRGRKSALNTLVSLVCDNIVNPEEQIIGIAHADAYEDSLYVMEEIRKRVKLRGFINTSYDYCTGSHVGPDTIALFFMAKDRELGEGKQG
jgi:DegV family protein with EDD domain